MVAKNDGARCTAMVRSAAAAAADGPSDDPEVVRVRVDGRILECWGPDAERQAEDWASGRIADKEPLGFLLRGWHEAADKAVAHITRPKGVGPMLDHDMWSLSLGTLAVMRRAPSGATPKLGDVRAVLAELRTNATLTRDAMLSRLCEAIRLARAEVDAIGIAADQPAGPSTAGITDEGPKVIAPHFGEDAATKPARAPKRTGQGRTGPERRDRAVLGTQPRRRLRRLKILSLLPQPNNKALVRALAQDFEKDGSRLDSTVSKDLDDMRVPPAAIKATKLALTDSGREILNRNRHELAALD